MTQTIYSDAELQGIAAINEDQHLGLLTRCGLSNDEARKIIAVEDSETLTKGIEMGRQAIAKFGDDSAQAAKIKKVIAATEREIIIRKA